MIYICFLFEQIFLKVAEDNGVDAEMSGKIRLSLCLIFKCRNVF